MKKLQILLLLTLLLTACKTKNKDVIIKGTIIGNETEELFCTAIFNNTYSGWFKDSVVLDLSGDFVISAKIDQPCFIGLLYKSNFKQIILEPGKTYEIEINGESNQTNFISEKTEAQNFYENLPDLHPSAYDFFQKDISDYKSIYESLNEKLNNELQELNKIKCSEEVSNLIICDRQVYYNLAISSLASRNNFASLRNNEATPNEVMEMWRKAVSDTFITNSQTKNATFFYDILDLTLWYKIYTELDYNNFWKIRKEKREQGIIHTHKIQLAQELLPEENIEFFTATYIQSSAKQSKFEKELINLFENFNTDFPNSNYTKYITQEIHKIVDFHKKAEQEFDKDMRFLDNYENINSLAECLQPFKGKKVYVDIWATWCSPCKDEFEHSKELKQLLTSKNVAMLYISTDRDRDEKRWKDMIKHYSLSGNHIRANTELKEDLRSILGSYGIPRYLIIDEKGKVVNYNAPQPSNFKELVKQL